MKMKVLILDKVPETLEWLRQEFQDTGWEEVIICLDPLQALEQVQKEQPNLIVVELHIPVFFTNPYNKKWLLGGLMNSRNCVLWALRFFGNAFFGDASKMGGLKFIKEIKKNGQIQSIPIFIFSGYAHLPIDGRADPHTRYRIEKNIAALDEFGVIPEHRFRKPEDEKKMLQSASELRDHFKLWMK